MEDNADEMLHYLRILYSRRQGSFDSSQFRLISQFAVE